MPKKCKPNLQPTYYLELGDKEFKKLCHDRKDDIQRPLREGGGWDRGMKQEEKVKKGGGA